MIAPKPWNFDLGSPESRAAARSIVRQRRSQQTRIQFFLSVRGPWRGDGPRPVDIPRAQPWIECPDGKLFRVVYVPHVWVARGESSPTCPECGTPYRKTREYPNYPLVGYCANCVERHIPDISPPA